MTKKNLLGANCGKYFPRQGKSSADYRLQMLSCLEDSFIFTQWSKWPMDRSYKQKRQKYYSEVTLVLLHYSKHIEDTHFMWTWSCRPFTVITDRPDGLQLLCTAWLALQVFRAISSLCWVGDKRKWRGRRAWGGPLSCRSTCKVLFPFCVSLLLNIKSTIHMPAPSGLTGLEHSAYWLKPPDVHSVLFPSNRCKVINQN